MKKLVRLINNLLFAILLLITASLACNLPFGPTSALVVALRFTGEPALTVYVGNPQEDLFWLPAGQYYFEAMDSSGQVYAGWWELIEPVTDGGDTVAIGRQISGNGQANEGIASQLENLADFALSVELAQLTYLEIASGGYQGSFQASVGDIHMRDIDPFYFRLQAIADQEETVLMAINALEARATAASSDSLYSSRASQLASRIILRQRSGVWDKFTSLIGFKGEEDERARQEILSVFSVMTPVEKEEAFFWLRTERIGGAQNYNEFLGLLEGGSIEDITEIRSDLYTGGPYQGVYQVLHPDSNRPGGENLHRAGAELIKRGAELEIEVVKEALTTAFPGIEQGFEYADKASEWSDFVRNIYVDPLGTLKDQTVEQIKNSIQDNIELDLMTALPDLDEEAAAQLAGSLTNEIMQDPTGLINAIAEVSSQSEQQSTATNEESASQVVGPFFTLADCQCGVSLPLDQDLSSASTNPHPFTSVGGLQVEDAEILTCAWVENYTSEHKTAQLTAHLAVYKFKKADDALVLYEEFLDDIVGQPPFCNEDRECTVAVAEVSEERAFYVEKYIFIRGDGVQLPSSHYGHQAGVLTDPAGTSIVWNLSANHPELELGGTWVEDLGQSVEACVMDLMRR